MYLFSTGDEAAYAAAVSFYCLFVLHCSKDRSLSNDDTETYLKLSFDNLWQGGDLRGVMAYNRLDSQVH